MIFWKEWRESRVYILAGTLALSMMSVIAIALYSTVMAYYNQTGEMEKGLQSIPFMTADQKAEMVETAKRVKDYGFYLWSQGLHANLRPYGLVLALLFGVSIFAKEFSKKTWPFLLTRPLSRKYIYGMKWSAAFIGLMIALIVSTAVLFTGAFISGKAFSVSRLLLSALPAYTEILIVFAFAGLFSLLLKDAIKAAGVTIISYIVILELPSWFKLTRDLSLAYHLENARVFLDGTFPWISVAVSLLLISLLIFSGFRYFSRMEIE